MIIKRVFIFLMISISLYAGDEKIVQDLSSNAVSLYDTMINMFKNMRWVFAIVPAAAVIVSVSKDISKFKGDTAHMDRGQDLGLKGEDIFAILLHVIIVLLSIFLVYGIFGLAYADADSMSEVWKILVADFWREIL